MNVKLSEIVGCVPVVVMLGMCKNACKTTALNCLISEYSLSGRSIAVTSVGRDGESVDLVTGTPKPPIYIHEGTLAATATGLLPLSDVSREILDVTDAQTPLGRVAVFKARSGGYVQLAGPSTVEEMLRLRKQLHGLGAQSVLIDGAMDRRSPAACALDGACVLSTGASLGSDFDAVVSETAFACKVLTLPECAEYRVQGTGYRVQGLGDRGHRTVFSETAWRFLAFRDGSFEGADSVEDLCALLKRTEAEGILFSGALTDTMARLIMQSGVKLDGFLFIAEDSSKILLQKEIFERLLAAGVNIMVRRGTKLAAVTVNPVSAGGWRFDAERFLEAMQRALPVPVVDALGVRS